jgi:hypothetical protein
MEEILGNSNVDAAFARFLANWRAIMANRIDEATSRIAAIVGVRGLILAGSNGLGQPWPLSDIDMIPIYADERAEQAIAQVEARRLTILDEWSTQGWRTGLDVGRLHFRVGELDGAFAGGDPDPIPLLADDRWYHTIDKAYGGRGIHDPDGWAARLATWFTANRFAPGVVALRLERSAWEAKSSLDSTTNLPDRGEMAAAWGAFLKAIQWRQVHLMEGWGERDNSLGRFGTRFGCLAHRHGLDEVAATFDALSGLDPQSVAARLERAPAWVHEWNDRSWRGRLAVHEPVTRLESDRDVLRVCTMYELRVVEGPPFPAWLAVPDAAGVRDRATRLAALVDPPHPP